MTTAYTNLLGLALPVTGELQGTWGDTVNNFITNYLDAAIAGTQTLSTDADVTLTKTTNAVLGATSSQYAILDCTGARTVQRTITVPAASKTYLVINATTGSQSVKVVGAGPTTGVVIANGERALIAWNGSDFVKIATTNGTGTFSDVTITGTGNALNFTNTAQRITGDFSNATLANRVAFQTSTANSTTAVAVIPNGSGTIARLQAYNASDPTNASQLSIGVESSTDVRLTSGITGTGTYLPMTFYTGGSERVRVDTSGNVGIGTASPSVRLDVRGGDFSVSRGTTAAADAAINFGSNSNNYIYSGNSSNVMTFATNGSERMRIDSSGNVGIGTASPGAKLDVAGNVRISGNSQLQIFNAAGTGGVSVQTDNASIPAMTMNTGGSERMRIDSSGNVGIGTASPAVRLETNVASGNNELRMTIAGVTKAQLISSATDLLSVNTGSGVYAFYNNGSERMRITSTGNIVAGASAALATTATDGFLYVPTCAGTPTGVPTAITGMAPIVVNTTNNKLYFYSGGAWRDAGP